jgi:hypothetical protein
MYRFRYYHGVTKKKKSRKAKGCNKRRSTSKLIDERISSDEEKETSYSIEDKVSTNECSFK